MAKILALAAASSLLVGSSIAATNGTECPANVTTAAFGLINNVTYLNTCAPGSTWKLTNLFEAANLSSSDFLKFCNASACMHPMHELPESIPEGCVATYNGKSIVLGEAVSAVHNECHKALDAAEGSHHDDDEKEAGHASGDHDDHDDDHVDDHAASNATGSKVPAPTPAKTSAATTISRTTLAAGIAVASAASTFVAMVL